VHCRRFSGQSRREFQSMGSAGPGMFGVQEQNGVVRMWANNSPPCPGLRWGAARHCLVAPVLYNILLARCGVCSW